VFLFKVPEQCQNKLETLKEYITSVTIFAVQLSFILPPEEIEPSAETFSCNTSKELPFAVDSSSAKENIPGPLQTFHPSPSLPAELRLDIWDLAFAEQCPEITAIKEERWKAHQLLRYTSKILVPTLLSINYESRSVMLSKAFPLFIEGKYTRWIPVNIKTSTLVLHLDFIGRGKLERKIDRISNVVSKETRNRIKTLRVDFRCNEELSDYIQRFRPNLLDPRWWSCPTPEDIHRLLELFPALDRLVFIPHTSVKTEGSHCFRGKSRFVEPDFTTKMWCHREGWASAVKTALLTTHYRADVKIPGIKLMELGVEGEEKKRYGDEAKKEGFWDVDR
jgi:hypothetical protein